jgi:hypothetical protein
MGIGVEVGFANEGARLTRPWEFVSVKPRLNQPLVPISESFFDEF